jgi:hypothetical protein
MESRSIMATPHLPGERQATTGQRLADEGVAEGWLPKTWMESGSDRRGHQFTCGMAALT